MKALPALQSLHQKYHATGLNVIGIDPFDKDAKALNMFLSKRNVSYKILLAENSMPKDYNVTIYPTMYLIDENGIIIHSQPGYGEGTEKKFEKIIAKNLKRMNTQF